MEADWSRWRRFWTDQATIGRKLREELGNWKNPTHRTWRWFYNKTANDLQRVEKNKLHHFSVRNGRTRLSVEYDVSWTEDYVGQELGAPTSVTTTFSEATVTKRNKGPNLAIGPSQPTDFWEFLESWGGMWMWEGMDEN